ncbi:hypothetical protein PPROV_000481500 [Pycnococcus provasolii]|uniref:Uncharacterized protein n=1 Tax=Pycnococcus provasolii TaxID=41880 RepID=A0A830HGW3_9CHLO|nr:hypothetical protein PPROV_000481500 [Pycnococcus provasolii]
MLVRNVTTAAARYAPTVLAAAARTMPATPSATLAPAAMKLASSLTRTTPSTGAAAACTLRGFAASAVQVATRRAVSSPVREAARSFTTAATSTTRKTAQRTTALVRTKATEAAAEAAAKQAAEATAKQAAEAAAVENLSFAQRYPFATNIIIATFKTSAADLIAQCVVEQKSITEVDWKRNMVFVVFGATYLGGVQYWIQVNMYKRWFPTMQRFANHPTMADKLKDVAGQIDVVKQIAFDVVIHLPFMYLPTFMVVKEFVQGKTWNPVDWVKDASAKYIKNFATDVKTMTMVWLPADIIIFSVPLYLRLPVRHVVSLAWTAYLSFLRGAANK